MRIYIAAPYELRPDACLVMHTLKSMGHEVTSTWLTSFDQNDDATARKDLQDVMHADLLLLLNPPEYANRGTGGRHVEVGYAIAMHIPIVIVGVRSNIFHHLNGVRVISRVEEL